MTSVAADNSPSHTRLHIAPLDSELLKVVLSAAVLPKAQNISYHSLETFPERRYGFVELPTEDAEKLRKKFHGAVLKGAKMKVEIARPATVLTPMGDEALASDKVSKKDKKEKKAKKDKSKKRKADGMELEGVQLEEGRKVKRGWTVTEDDAPKKDKRDKASKDKDGKALKTKRKTRSKYTNHEECLVRTVLPPNAVAAAGMDEKKKKDKSREVTIHEFERTTKFPTFLKDSTTSAKAGKPAEFIDGKGWVDEEGNVVEPAKKRRAPLSAKGKPVKADTKPGTESEGTSDSEEDEDGTVEDKKKGAAAPTDSTASVMIEELSSPLNSKSDGRPKSSGSTRSLSIKIPPAVSPATPAPIKVHPLEALYKRSKKEEGENDGVEPAAQGFSFFGSGDVDIEEEDVEAAPLGRIQLPMTPFSRQDLEYRNLRSAAPTPDTAHPSRSFKPWSHDDAEDNLDEEDDENEEEAEGVPHASQDDMDVDSVEGNGTANKTDQATSDFQTWFWDNRGDLNRSWKKRRKSMAKEKRYRDNKARAERAI